MQRYFYELVTAFVRGRLGIETATAEDGLRAGLRLHKFERNTELPRVQRVIGVLRGLAPENLLDVGSGRGTFLWPLLAAFPLTPVTAIDISERRVADIAAVRRGGISRLTVGQMNAEKMAFAPGSFDTVTMLEVLEHMPHPISALQCAVATVPSVPDDNPGHLHLFTPGQLHEMARAAGFGGHVLNHRIAIVRVQP